MVSMKQIAEICGVSVATVSKALNGQKDIGVETRELNIGFAVGDSVKVLDGPLEGFIGTVEELEPERNRVRVAVSMFGRETPVDLELDQVESVQ